MNGLIAVVVAVALLQSARPEITSDHHVAMQDLCSSLPNPQKSLGNLNLNAEEQAQFSDVMKKVCEIYDRQYIHKGTGAVQTRSLLGGLSDLVGSDSKLGTLLKAAEALNRAKDVLNDVKKFGPEVHNHVQSSIQDVHNSLQDLIDSITNEFIGKTTPKSTF